MARIKTKYTGIYYRESKTNGKSDKTYYITYKDNNNKMVELKIGRFSEGVREAYCNQKRNEIITRLRLGEELPVIAKLKKKKINELKIISEQYFSTRKSNDTTKADIGICNHYILPHFKDIDSIDKTALVKWKNYLINTTLIRSDDPLSIKYRNDILSLLITINNFGIKNNLTKNNFTKYIEKDKVDNARERFLSIGEIKELYSYVEEKDDITSLVFYKLALSTGGRLATVQYISKKDIDFTHKLVTLKDFKNNTTYKAFLNDKLLSLLENYTNILTANDKLFPINHERKLRRILNDLFNKNIEKNDTKNKAVIHTLRHTFASHLAINGTPIFTIQKLMNHRDIKMTLRYAKLSPDSGRDSVVSLGF
ncbi:MAG: site-specific integrase [Epsilonproteobacteria bacterium]|nr:MAG: site-specific integrase [Campylobacterota bacterium]